MNIKLSKVGKDGKKRSWSINLHGCEFSLQWGVYRHKKVGVSHKVDESHAGRNIKQEALHSVYKRVAKKLKNGYEIVRGSDEYRLHEAAEKIGIVAQAVIKNQKLRYRILKRIDFDLLELMAKSE